MSIRFHLVEPGMTLYQKTRRRMGNTTLRCDATYTVQIIEKDDKGCLVSWNGNTPRRMWKRDVEKLYRNDPRKPRPTPAAKEET